MIATLILLAGCARGSRFTELHHDQPSSYYLYVPRGYNATDRWPLFIALHTIGEDSQDCISEWFEIADENQFFLLCPQMVVDGDQLDRAANERVLADILSQLYQDYTLRDRFFLAGRGAAANFALGYAFRYPQAIEGISSIAAASYPGDATAVGSFPILVIVEEKDQTAIEAGETFITAVDSGISRARLLKVDNLGKGIPYSVQRLTYELFEQISR